MKIRRQHSPEFKVRVAMEAAKGGKTISQVASEFAVHPNLVTQWKRELLEKGAEVFGSTSAKEAREARALSARETELYEQIGRLKMELEWLKKSYAVRQMTSAS